jgi:hypothetical protein
MRMVFTFNESGIDTSLIQKQSNIIFAYFLSGADPFSFFYVKIRANQLFYMFFVVVHELIGF